MNEKAEQLIIDASEKVLAYLEATEGFAVEQAPLLAQEIVRYGMKLRLMSGRTHLPGIVRLQLLGREPRPCSKRWTMTDETKPCSTCGGEKRIWWFWVFDWWTARFYYCPACGGVVVPQGRACRAGAVWEQG